MPGLILYWMMRQGLALVRPLGGEQVRGCKGPCGLQVMIQRMWKTQLSLGAVVAILVEVQF
jgi:hypothetical protein